MDLKAVRGVDAAGETVQISAEVFLSYLTVLGVTVRPGFEHEHCLESLECCVVEGLKAPEPPLRWENHAAQVKLDCKYNFC